MKGYNSNLKIHRNGTVEISLSTMGDISLKYNDLLIEYIKSTNIVVLKIDLPAVKWPQYMLKVLKPGLKVNFKCRFDFQYMRINIFDCRNIKG